MTLGRARWLSLVQDEALRADRIVVRSKSRTKKHLNHALLLFISKYESHDRKDLATYSVLHKTSHVTAIISIPRNFSSHHRSCITNNYFDGFVQTSFTYIQNSQEFSKTNPETASLLYLDIDQRFDSSALTASRFQFYIMIHFIESQIQCTLVWVSPKSRAGKTTMILNFHVVGLHGTRSASVSKVLLGISASGYNKAYDLVVGKRTSQLLERNRVFLPVKHMTAAQDLDRKLCCKVSARSSGPYTRRIANL